MTEYRVIAAIPAFNEEDRIEATIEGLKQINEIDRIIVIDDGSTDKTSEKVKNFDVDLIRFEKNKGKGAALKEVFKSYNYEYICLVDGDLAKSSQEVEKLLEPVLSAKVDFTIARFPSRNKPGKKAGFGLVKGLAMRGIKFYTGMEVDNSLSGQRVYKKEVIDSLSYIPNNYGIEVAMTTEALKKGFTYEDVLVDMSHRYTDHSVKGYFHRGKQFLNILKTFIVMFFKR